MQSGPARGGWNRLSRCQEPREDAQPKRQRRPTNSRPTRRCDGPGDPCYEPTGRETRATRKDNGPGDPCYEEGQRAGRPVLRRVGWCRAGQPAADGIALPAAGSRTKMHSQNGSAAPPIAGHTTMRRPGDPSYEEGQRAGRPVLRTHGPGDPCYEPTGRETRATREGTGRETRATERGCRAGGVTVCEAVMV